MDGMEGASVNNAIFRDENFRKLHEISLTISRKIGVPISLEGFSTGSV